MENRDSMEESRETLVRVRKAFQDTYLRGRIPKYLLNQQCCIICEKLANPDHELLELEKTLRTCALLPLQEELASVPDKKFVKKQRTAILNAFVCNYQWSYSDWREMKDHPVSRTMVHPEELPAHFVCTALAAFQGIIGNGVNKIRS